MLAHYSALKVAAWIIGVGAVSAWILLDAAGRGWRLLEGRAGLIYPAAVFGALCGLLWSLALLVNFALARGAAIAESQGQLIFYYPFSRRRVAFDAHLIVSANTYEAAVQSGSITPSIWPTVIRAEQVTISRPGCPVVNFRTGLLSEKADTIVNRIAAAAGGKVGGG